MREQDGDVEPAHHARRPMNAFLIFCKRHRSVVREKYPNLENRSITKILGEWWANLDKEDKSSYTNLAKQYKDAFFDANPDFKWYKLPAPPLRNITRPRESRDKAESAHCDDHDYAPEKTNNNSTQVDFNKKLHLDDLNSIPKPLTTFTPGKLADEAQMGGLSSLLSIKTETLSTNSYYAPPSFKYNSISQMKEEKPHIEWMKHSADEDSKASQHSLHDATSIFDDYDDEKRSANRPVKQDQITNQDVINQIVDKGYYKDECVPQKMWLDDDKNTRSARTCKGKRYREFMTVGGLIVNKRKRGYSDKSEDAADSASCSWETVPDDAAPPDEEVPKVKIEQADDETDSPKAFKATDFDLDAKIKALPSLSIEEFQEKKRDRKRKKRTCNWMPKERVLPVSNASYQEAQRRQAAESYRETMTGSQKRKPKKMSITRLEVNSLMSSVGLLEVRRRSPERATEAPPAHDLLALATLAEVAANTSKIEEHPSARHADHRAST